IIGGASGTPSLTLPGNFLTKVDSDFETGAGTWVNNSNASSIANGTNIAAVGTHSLKWVATAGGQSSIITGFYNINALNGVIGSAFMMTTRPIDCQISIAYYNSSNTLLSQTDSQAWTSFPGAWQPLSVPGYTPANTAKFKIIVSAGTSGSDPSFLPV